nr:PREDICTED: eukaryotic translation initiation factor 3 subunit A-like [Stegastes partitus]
MKLIGTGGGASWFKASSRGCLRRAEQVFPLCGEAQAMSRQLFTDLRRSGGNYIPSGRQIPRTPPPVTIHTTAMKTPTGDPDSSEHTRTCDFSCSAVETDDPTSVLRGMKGYQLTPGDLEFIKKMKEEQLVKKLEGDLTELQELIEVETVALEWTEASRQKAQAELHAFPSCEELAQWLKVLLRTTSPLAELTDVDTRCLLAAVTAEDVQSVSDEKRTELSEMKKVVADKRQKEAEQRRQLEKETAAKQLKILTLRRELCDLKSELAQQEEAFKLKSGAASENPTKSVPAARGKQNKVQEQEFSSQEAELATRGARRKPAGAAQATASQPKRPEKAGEAWSMSQQLAAPRSRKKAAAGEEAQNTGLRRSKRIATRRYQAGFDCIVGVVSRLRHQREPQ